MGGSLRYVTRKNGEVKAWDGYTNAIHNVQTPAFLLGNSTPFSENFTGDPAMNGVYPDGYGLVVVDFDQKWIGHAQSYSDLGSLHVGMLSLDYRFNLEANTWQPKLGTGHVSHLFLECLAAGFLTHTEWSVETGEGPREELRPVPPEMQANPEAFLDFVLNEAARERRWMFGEDGEPAPAESLNSVLVSPPGWTFERFDTTVEGWHRLATALLDSGFDLSLHAGLWDGFVSDFSEEDEEAVQAGDKLPLPPVSTLIAEHLRQTLGDRLPSGLAARTKKTL